MKAGKKFERMAAGHLRAAAHLACLGAQLKPEPEREGEGGKEE